MTKRTISDYYNHGHRARGADKLKFFLMPFVIFVLFGFPTRFGGYVKIYSNFVAPAFYILCGFFVLCPDAEMRSEKIKRALKKSFKFFAALFITYSAISIVYFTVVGADWIPEVLRRRTLFDFFVFNMWPQAFPLGNSIWFIQSLFYAYVFFYIAERAKLSRYYAPVFIVCFLIMLFTGEFSAIVGFPYFGYMFIPGGAVTRAIPYMLLGMFVRKNADKFLTFRKRIYIIFFTAGILLTYLEIELLSRFHILKYYGHLIGLGIMALSVCCLALSYPILKENFLTLRGRRYARRIYALCQPVAFFITLIISMTINSDYFGYFIEYRSLIVYLLSIGIAYLVGISKYDKFIIGNS